MEGVGDTKYYEGFDFDLHRVDLLKHKKGNLFFITVLDRYKEVREVCLS